VRVGGGGGGGGGGGALTDTEDVAADSDVFDGAAEQVL